MCVLRHQNCNGSATSFYWNLDNFILGPRFPTWSCNRWCFLCLVLFFFTRSIHSLICPVSSPFGIKFSLCAIICCNYIPWFILCSSIYLTDCLQSQMRLELLSSVGIIKDHWNFQILKWNFALWNSYESIRTKDGKFWLRSDVFWCLVDKP